MLFYIPVKKFEKLEKLVRRYQKKGANIVFNTNYEVVVCDGTLYVNDPMTHTTANFPIKVDCYEVEVEGKYQINGWSFVGTVEFTELGNIIRLADNSFDGKVPEKYLHTPKICEHCGKIRNRKDTYLIYNAEKDDWKQVGSTCLLEYTRGLDAEICADIMSCLNKVVTLGELSFDEESFFGDGYNSTGCGVGHDVKNYAIALVNKYGYQKMFNGMGTAADLSTWYFNLPRFGVDTKKFDGLTPATDEEVEAIEKFAQEHLEDGFGYMRNASIAWLKDSIEYRDFGLICSFVFTYNKEMNKQELQKAKLADKNNEWVGNIGDRITIKVANIKLLYSSDIEVAWHTYAFSYTYQIIDEEGHTFIWKSSKELTNEWKEIKAKDYENFDKERFSSYDGDWDINVLYEYTPKTIVATVKEHSQFRGLKQTVITRGKITEKTDVKVSSQFDKH